MLDAYTKEIAMKYGMNMLLWTGDCTTPEFPALFERLKKTGFDLVEIPIFDPNPKTLAALGKTLEGIGLERTAVTCLNVENNLIGEDKKQRAAGVAHLKAVIDCCQAMGAKKLVGPLYAALGVFSGKGPTKQELQWAADGLREAGDHAKKAGVTLALEYLNRFEIYLLNCAADTAKLVREINHPNVKMMYDTFHANIEEKNIAEALDACKDVMCHVHISENDRSTPGKGGVNWKENWANLKRIGYKDLLVIEAFGQGLPALAAATKIWRKMFPDEETLAKDGLAFMKQSWEG
jgi:D-psicose/D-tagatose/L-ribulose 3-epimerase